MRVFELTRTLIDIPSVTPEEEQVGIYLRDYLARLCNKYGGILETFDVEAKRWNVFASFGEPVVTLSTHMDTVPPFIESREDHEFIWGRGACDTKGIIASMLIAAEQLLVDGTRNFALLFVVGEERNSAGAYHAAQNPRGSKFVINGEPTENQLALGSKGALRYELIARGKMAHSAYPELGESAINKLLDALEAIRKIQLPSDPVLGPSTLNIGTIRGGRAPNVIADEARAEIFIRLVCDSAATRTAILEAVGDKVELNDVLEIPALRLLAVQGLPTTVVAYTTDIPAFNGAWGQPLLLGPGTIHVAHTLEERVPKQQLLDAVEIYQRMVRQLQNTYAQAAGPVVREKKNL
jgi:acetylornithine deacetylase